MTKRLLLIGGLVLLVTVAIVTRFRFFSARAAVSVAVLQPTQAFQIQGIDALHLKDVAVYNGDLFLLLNDGGGSNQILRTTGRGEILQKIPLPNLPQLRHFGQLRVSQSGTLAVSYFHLGPAPLTTVSLYDTDGTLKTSFEVRFFDEIAFIGDDLVGVEPNGITRLTSQSQFEPNAGNLPLVVLDPSRHLIAASLPQNKLAIVEPVLGRLQIAAMESIIVAPMVLYAPEIQGVERDNQGNGVLTAIVHTIAASPGGNLYVGITGAKRQEGAPVLQFDSSGILTNRIKCILPTFGLDPSNHESYMYPKKLLATNDSLFWISESEKKFAVYSLDNLH
jgi:hypothetical protein